MNDDFQQFAAKAASRCCSRGRSCLERPSRNVAEHVLIGQITCGRRVGHRLTVQRPESLDGQLTAQGFARDLALAATGPLGQARQLALELLVQTYSESTHGCIL